MSTLENPTEFYKGLVVVDEKRSKKVVTKRAKETTEVFRKETTKKVAQEPVVKKTDKKVSKTTSKVNRTLKKIKMSQYNTFDLDTCFGMAKMMGVDMNYQDYTQILVENDNTKRLAQKIIKKYDISSKFTFDDYGFDEDIIEVICNKVLDTMDISASDFKSLTDEFISMEEYEYGKDSFEDNQSFQSYTNTMNKMLMLAQRKGYTDLKGVKKSIKMDPEKAILNYAELAKKVLKLWEMDDVKKFEKFIYSILSQFEDLYEKYEYIVLMDVCDLYIIHGELKKGNNDYEYVIRESGNKDYPYYRYANIYQQVDSDYSKEIARRACQIISKDSQYYSDIKKIMEA